MMENIYQKAKNKIYRKVKKEIYPKIEFISKIIKNKELVKYQRESILLRSIPKSGTIYLRLLLTNYLFNYNNFLNGNIEFENISYNKMHEEIFPNVRHWIYRGDTQLRKRGENESEMFFGPFIDFMYDHGSPLDKLPKVFAPKKMILLYRNPLDQMVSHFFWKNYKKGYYDNPKDLLKTEANQFISRYKQLKSVKQKLNEKALMVSYEQLKLAPRESLERILRFLELKIYPNLIELSIKASSKDKVKEEEKEEGKPIHIGNKYHRDSFIRDDSVGGWKNYFDENDFALIEEEFNKKGFTLNHFYTEGY